jgi:radical SAM superfamily enzyme YgiQ (UPF0313 family)
MILHCKKYKRKINKIMLVFPPSSLAGVGMEESFLPNGLLSIAAFISKIKPEIEIRVLDGSIVSLDEICNEIMQFCPDLIGFSILLGNYSNAKKMFNVAKIVDSITVVGNHHAKYLFNLIKGYPDFEIPGLDFIIEGKRGEYSFLSLIEAIENGCSFDNIDSLAYKTGKYFVVNKTRKDYPSIEKQVQPDLSFIIDFIPYFKSYSKIFKNFHEEHEQIKQININYIEGCYQGCFEPCIYCCLKDHNIDFLNPEKYWGNIHKLIDKGFNYFFETCNSLSSLQFIKYNGSSYLESLAYSVPKEIYGKYKMMVYARADEINDLTLSAFKKIGVQRVIFGFDSGDNTVLKEGIKKVGISANTNIEAAKSLNNTGIQIYACYVPGSENESSDSLSRTYCQIQELLDLENTSVIEFTSLAPMPGSAAWKEISANYLKTYGLSDEVNIQNLAKNWIYQKAPNVTWELIQEYKEKIKELTLSKNKIFGGYY